MGKELAKANASNANPIVVVVSPLFALILIIISDVFGDIDGDLQYDSEKFN